MHLDCCVDCKSKVIYGGVSIRWMDYYCIGIVIPRRVVRPRSARVSLTLSYTSNAIFVHCLPFLSITICYYKHVTL